MFWTLQTPRGPSLLCERCALFAVNSATFDYIRRPFGSVQEAVEFLAEKSAEAGLEPLDITNSPFGVCGHCGEDVLQPAEAS